MSPATRFEAHEWNATYRPSPLTAGQPLWPLGDEPPTARLTRVVVAVCRSWTKMSDHPPPSPGTRSLAAETNATYRPSALMAGRVLAA